MSEQLSGALSGAINEMLEGSIAGNIKLLGAQPVIESKSITANGTYTAPEGVDGYSPITVNVPIKEEVIGSITENGTHTPPEGKVYKEVVVNVPAPDSITGTFTENGTFTPPSGKVWNEAVVNVPAPDSITGTFTENGTFTPPSGKLWNQAVVNVSPTEYFTITNRIYGESAMNYANIVMDKFDSVWNGGSSVGFSINGLVNLRGKSKVIIDVDNIGTSYLNGQYPRFNFNCGLTTEIYNTFVLLDYNTSGKLVDYVIAPYSDYYGLSYHGEITIPDRDCYLYIGCNGVNAQGISVKVI